MDRLNVVSFSADFPDDSEWDEQGTEIVPGGQAITHTIKAYLEEQGVSCSDIGQHSTYGWAFDTLLDDSRIWLLFTAAEGGWLIQLVPYQSLISRLLGHTGNTGFKTIQRILHKILSEDKRFCRIKWYAKDDYDNCNEASAKDSPF